MTLEFQKFQALTSDQAISLLEIRNQAYVRENMYNPAPISRESHLKWIETLHTREDCIYWAIILDQKIIGAIDLTSIDRNSAFAEWGYYVDAEYFGIGAIIEFLGIEHFIEMGFRQIKAGVKESNRRVYEMHIGVFGFVPCPEYSTVIDGSKFLGASLSVDNWTAVRQQVQSKIKRILDRMQVKWY